MSKHYYFRCDRCGIKIDKLIPTRVRISLKPTIEEIKNGRPASHEDSIDLCNECMKTFINWLNFEYEDVELK